MALANFLLVSLLAGLSIAQKDPLVNFCRRFGHQTAVVDRKLYIDGGLVNFDTFVSDPQNYTNKDLLYADFDVVDKDMPMEYNNLTKPASIPSVNGGILWEDTINKVIYLYGGEYHQSSPESFTTWAYNTLNKSWKSIDPDARQGDIKRASYGAGVAVQDIGIGFYYGGWLSNQTVPSFGPNPIALSNLLSYDMPGNTWRNATGPDSIGRAEGVMTYLPASKRGMLVYFGGIQTPYGNESWTGVPMSEIRLYDIASTKWYNQKATGDIPDMRRRFCAGATWAQDQSSYNIYLYGGLSMPPFTVGFDDVYILTIPSFTWIRWFPTARGTRHPHHSLSCNVVDGAQMLVMGGTFPNSTACDEPDTFGIHNMDLGKNNPDGEVWFSFSPNKITYQVPSEIIAVVGGGARGGATVKAPQDGFAEGDLATYFQHIHKPLTRPTSSATSNSKKSNIGPIAGGAAGGAVFLLVVIALLAYLCIRQRRRTAAAAATAENHQNRPYPQHYQQPSQNMQGPHIPAGELTGEILHELPTVLSPTISKSRMNYGVHSLSSATSSTTYSPPHSPPHLPPQSPPLAHDMHSPGYSYRSQSPNLTPYGVPPYQEQTFYQPRGHAYSDQQPYPAMQTVYAPPPPQQHYVPPPQQYYPPPPQDDSPYIHVPEVRRPSNPAAANNVRRRDVGSVSSAGTSPGPGPFDKNEQERS